MINLPGHPIFTQPRSALANKKKKFLEAGLEIRKGLTTLAHISEVGFVDKLFAAMGLPSLTHHEATDRLVPHKTQSNSTCETTPNS